MPIYDVTMPIEEKMVMWPGEPQPMLKKKQGKFSHITEINISCHAGTHIDAPFHFVKGAKTVDEIDITKLWGPVIVVEVGATNLIELAHVEKIDEIKNKRVERVIFKTRNTKLLNKNGFQEDYVSISAEAARYLVNQGITLVGVDYYSVERYKPDHPHVHLAFLKNEVVVVEGLNLANIKPGLYEMVALPLKIEGSDGSPARVLLRN